MDIIILWNNKNSHEASYKFMHYFEIYVMRVQLVK